MLIIVLVMLLNLCMKNVSHTNLCFFMYGASSKRKKIRRLKLRILFEKSFT